MEQQEQPTQIEVYHGILYDKVYTYFDGYDSDKSIYISFQEAMTLIPRNVIEDYFSQNFKSSANLHIKAVIDDTDRQLKLYLYLAKPESVEVQQISKDVYNSLFYGFGENGFQIKYQTKSYTFFIRY